MCLRNLYYEIACLNQEVEQASRLWSIAMTDLIKNAIP
jgi:hypothetical protein